MLDTLVAAHVPFYAGCALIISQVFRIGYAATNGTGWQFTKAVFAAMLSFPIGGILIMWGGGDLLDGAAQVNPFMTVAVLAGAGAVYGMFQRRAHA